MDRALYPEGVEVHQRDLERTETTKISNIKRRLLDMANTGVLTGGTVTPSGVQVVIGPFTGYTSGGEYITYTGSSSLNLKDYTASALNYVIATYTEQDTNYEPHETNGNSYPTSAVTSIRITVLSAAEYAALPATDNNLSNDALDRTLLLAVVTASGTGISLTASSIVHSIDFGGAIVATNLTGTIGGVTILNTEKTTPPGNGILALTVAGPVKTVTWKAPGDGFAGSPIDISISGTYVLYSGNAIQYIRVSVVGSSLPASSTSDTIQIANIYSQTVPRFSAEDIHHRTMIGSGISSSTNPHGLTAADLGVSTLFSAHQQVFHNNGILPGSSSSFLACTVYTTGADAIDIGAPSSGDRFYVNGNEFNDVGMGAGETVLRRLSFTGLDNTQILFDIYLKEGTGGIGIPTKRERARYNMPISTLASKVQLRDLSDNAVAGTAYLNYSGGSGGTLQFKSAGSSYYGVGVPVPVSPTPPQVLRLWNFDGTQYIDVYVNNNFSGASVTATLIITTGFSGTDINANMKIGTVMWYNDELGNGYPILGNNLVKDKRVYGMMCAQNIRDDVGKWEFGYVGGTDIYSYNNDKLDWITERDTPATRSQRSISTLRKVGIGTNAPFMGSILHVFNNATDAAFAIIGDCEAQEDSIGVYGIGTGGGAGVWGRGLRNGPGVVGIGDDTQFGVYGIGGLGGNSPDTGSGVYGSTQSDSSAGVYGIGLGDSSYGVYGYGGFDNSIAGVGGVGFNAAAVAGTPGGTGIFGSGGAGGNSADGGIGVIGTGGAPGSGGVGGYGGYFTAGTGGVGVYATSGGTAIQALATGNGIGVSATGAGSGIGVDVTSSSGIGVRVNTTGGNHAGSFTANTGSAAVPAVEIIANTGPGLSINSSNSGMNLDYGIYAQNNASSIACITGLNNGSGDGVIGFTSGHGNGVIGSGATGGGYGVYAAGKATPNAAGDKAPFRMTPITVSSPNSKDAGAMWFYAASPATSSRLYYFDGTYTYGFTPSTIV